MPAERRSLLSKNASSKISTICNYKFSYFLCNVAASTVHHQHAKNLKLKHRRTKNAIKSNSCHKFSILRFTFFALIFFFFFAHCSVWWCCKLLAVELHKFNGPLFLNSREQIQILSFPSVHVPCLSHYLANVFDRFAVHVHTHSQTSPKSIYMMSWTFS